MRFPCQIALAAVLLGGCGATEPSTPNLLVVTLDTLRADHLGTYGYNRPTSPNLDAFATRSTVFEDATCAIPTTLPSHASMFTGLRPNQHGMRLNGVEPPRDFETIFDGLKLKGLRTAAIIGSKVVHERYLTGFGIDEVIYSGSKKQYQISGDKVTASGIEWLEAHGSEPFSLWMHYYDTHEPYAPKEPWLSNFDRGYSGDLPQAIEVKQLTQLNRSETPASRADVEHVVDLYDAEISYLDAQIGLLLATLDRLTLSENTIVVLIADHGQALGDSAFWGHGLRFLEPIIKVPFIVRLPGQTTERRIASPVESIDLFPTLAELYGFQPPPGLPGRSLVGALSGEEPPASRVRVVERRAYPDQPEVVGAAIHATDWKAIYYRDEDGSELSFLGRTETGLDGENHFDPNSKEAEWLQALVAELRDAGSTERVLDEDQEEMLRTLGYLN